MHTTHLLNDKEPHNFEFWYPLNGQSVTRRLLRTYNGYTSRVVIS